MLIAGTAAKIARKRVPDFVLRGVRVLLQKWHKRHQNARRAVSTLESMRLPERLLNGVQFIRVWRQPFDSGDLMTVRLDREQEAGTRRLTIEQNGAGAADPVFTTDMCSREPQFMAQKIAEEQA